MDTVAQTIRETYRIAFTPHQEAHPRHVVIRLVLQVRHINRRRRRRIERAMLHATDNADHFAEPGRFAAISSPWPGIVNSDLFPDRVLARPKLPRGLCVNDDDCWRLGVVT